MSVNPNGIVCFEGDSRTQARPWTGQALENACFALQPTNGFAFNKRGYDISAIGGSVVSAMAARAAVVNAKIISGYTNYLCVWIGYNNAAVSTTQQIFDAIKAYCIAAKAAGWSKIVLCTEIDAVTTGWTAKYQALNVLIKADNSFYDVLADLGARAELQDNTNLTYYSADHIHPNDVGFDIVRGVVQAALQTLSL